MHQFPITMSEQEQWWQRNIRLQRELMESHKEFSYADLLKTVDFSKPLSEWDYAWGGEICDAFRVPYDYSMEGRFPFISERRSSLTWICTDSEVGVYFLFLVEDGKEIPIGTREQDARKSSSQYYFFDRELYFKVRNMIIEQMKKEPEEPILISMDRKCIESSH